MEQSKDQYTMDMLEVLSTKSKEEKETLYNKWRESIGNLTESDEVMKYLSKLIKGSQR